VLFIPRLLEPYREGDVFDGLCRAVAFDADGPFDFAVNPDVDYFAVEGKTLGQKTDFKAGFASGKILNNNGIPSRLKILRETLQQNSAKFARNIGIPRSTYVGYESESAMPANVLIAISEKFGVSTDWLLTGMGDIFEKRRKNTSNYGDDIPADDGKLRFTDQPDESTLELVSGPENSLQEDPGGDIGEGRTPMARTGEIPLIYSGDERLKQGIVIPFLEDQAVSAGKGTELDEGDNPTRYLRVPEYLAKYPDLAMLPVRGDSMDPTLHDGDMVVCDGGGWDGDGIYVIKSSEKAFVKRVLFTPEGYQVISDNKMYPSYGANDENLRIVGKVRAAMIMIPGRRGEYEKVSNFYIGLVFSLFLRDHEPAGRCPVYAGLWGKDI
jgi:DNA-binding XRE family transcriptional regulator